MMPFTGSVHDCSALPKGFGSVREAYRAMGCTPPSTYCRWRGLLERGPDRADPHRRDAHHGHGGRGDRCRGAPGGHPCAGCTGCGSIPASLHAVAQARSPQSDAWLHVVAPDPVETSQAGTVWW